MRCGSWMLGSLRRSGGMNSAYMPREAIFQVSPLSRVCHAPPQEMPSVMRRCRAGRCKWNGCPDGHSRRPNHSARSGRRHRLSTSAQDAPRSLERNRPPGMVPAHRVPRDPLQTPRSAPASTAFFRLLSAAADRRRRDLLPRRAVVGRAPHLDAEVAEVERGVKIAFSRSTVVTGSPGNAVFRSSIDSGRTAPCGGDEQLHVQPPSKPAGHRSRSPRPPGYSAARAARRRR